MEFVGNKINAKTVLVSLAVAFLVGRISIFSGAFPAAVALITVMMAVSTVYIYFVPVMAAAILSYLPMDVDGMGDIIAVAICGIVFLFFHKNKFTINQRTAIAAAAILIGNYMYHAISKTIYLVDIELLAGEIIGVVIYIRVLNTLARMIFTGRGRVKMSEEKVWTSFSVLLVSVIGGFDVPAVVITLWIFAVGVVEYCKGIQASLTVAAAAMVYYFAMDMDGTNGFVAAFTGIIAGWFCASIFDGNYRKAIMAIGVFVSVGVMASQWIYYAGVAMAVFTMMPDWMLNKYWCALKDMLSPNVATAADIKLERAIENLTEKRKTFSDLAKLYGSAMDKREIISYQFDGMSRTVDAMLRQLSGDETFERTKVSMPVKVGSASYAFEDVCGDSSMSFSFGKESQAIIISDGMGKGSAAAAESKLVVTTLSKLLSAGFDADVALKTVNGILMSGSKDDMFATVDMAIINKRTGRAEIFKMGAASTFVKHDGKVFMMKRPAPPVGIIEGMKLEYIDVKLKTGDLLIMVSDGVTDCDRDDPGCAWLKKRLEELGSRDPETVAELVVNKAAEKYGIRERDDLTVMVAAI